MSPIHETHFSVEGARKALQEIHPLLESIAALKQHLDRKGTDLSMHPFFGGTGANGEAEKDPEMLMLIQQIREIQRRGIQVKGVQPALLDFPHKRDDGEEVYLCWLAGEETIKAWHKIEDGFKGRKPLSEL